MSATRGSNWKGAKDWKTDFKSRGKEWKTDFKRREKNWKEVFVLGTDPLCLLLVSGIAHLGFHHQEPPIITRKATGQRDFISLNIHTEQSSGTMRCA